MGFQIVTPQTCLYKWAGLDWFSADAGLNAASYNENPAYLASQGNFKSIIITIFVQMAENKNVLNIDKGVPLDACNEMGLEVNNNKT